MNSKFQEYVTSTAFNLTLSKYMITCLLLVRDTQNIYHPDKWKDGSVPSRTQAYSVSYAKSLEYRGLIEHWSDSFPTEDYPDVPYIHKLTKAGEMVCDLLVEAGLMPAEQDKQEDAA